MFFPLALGAQGSCRIGGNVSTNAGGVNVLRYAMTRELVLGLEVVLPDGSVFNGLSTMRKDNRSIDLKQLFIGAEGIFGIVTAVAIKLMPLPDKVESAMISTRGSIL
jgi:FAD/FMN-containing dehydrogenase